MGALVMIWPLIESMLQAQAESKPIAIVSQTVLFNTIDPDIDHSDIRREGIIITIIIIFIIITISISIIFIFIKGTFPQRVRFGCPVIRQRTSDIWLIKIESIPHKNCNRGMFSFSIVHFSSAHD